MYNAKKIERRDNVMKIKQSKRVASMVKCVLDKTLIKEANSASSAIFFQEKEPDGMKRFKKVR